jgi:hypothetical protein
MYNSAGTINKTATFGTTNMSERYYLDPTRPTVISTAIYNTSTTNNNFSNTDESGIMYINAGQATNFRTTRLLQRSPFNGITRYSEFDANSVNDYFYVDSANLDRQKATVTVERGDTIDALYNNGKYTIETGKITLKAKASIIIDRPITPNYTDIPTTGCIGNTIGFTQVFNSTVSSNTGSFAVGTAIAPLAGTTATVTVPTGTWFVRISGTFTTGTSWIVLDFGTVSTWEKQGAGAANGGMVVLNRIISVTSNTTHTIYAIASASTILSYVHYIMTRIAWIKFNLPLKSIQ